jgi:hypothetical protein
MEVIDRRKPKVAHFEDVYEGEMFFDPDNEMFCMRIQECFWDNGEEPANAIDLADGQLVFYEKTDEIVKVRGRVDIFE